MSNIGVNTKRGIFFFVLAMLIILGLYLLVRSQIRAYEVFTLCSTPDVIGSIEGQVVNDADGQPLSDVRIVIKNATQERSICPNIGYIFEEQLLSDAEGHFITHNTVHRNQSLDITFYKEGCNTSTRKNVPATTFMSQPLLYEIPTFRLVCSK